MSVIKTVGAYEAKTSLPALLALVGKGREVVITKHNHPVARLVPIKPKATDGDVFDRINSLRSQIKMAKGETPKDLINAGRRI